LFGDEEHEAMCEFDRRQPPSIFLIIVGVLNIPWALKGRMLFGGRKAAQRYLSPATFTGLRFVTQADWRG
jgi:hypothetical protein